MSTRTTKILQLALAPVAPNENNDRQSDVNYFDMDSNSNCFLFEYDASSRNVHEKGETNENEQCTKSIVTKVTPAPGISNLYDGNQSDISFDDSDADPDFCPSESDKECEASRQDVNDNTLDNSNEDKQCAAIVPKKYARKLKQFRKTCRNTGKEYTTMSGKIIKERQSKLLSNCRNKCNEKITRNEKDKLFQDYWKLGTHDKRAAYIASMIDINDKKTTKINVNIRTEKNKCRQVTYKYHVEVRGKRTIVCKKCFRDIFDENSKFITIAMTKKRETGNSLEQSDKRGKGPPIHKHSVETKDLILKHINSFPAYESHYTRKRTQKKYLGSELNLSKMYQLYKETVPQPVGRTLYESVFRSLNLSFKRPKADTCQKCDSLNMKLTICTPEEKLAIQTELHTHQQEAETAYNCKSSDKNKAKEDPTFTALVFDLQQCLPTPFLQTNIAFYKRQLWTFNLTIHNLKDGSATCYMWHECVGGRGGNQIASCLFKHLNNMDPQIKHIVLYSDTCGGQNKNTHVAAMFIMLLQQNKNIDIIDHKFLIPGHTHMECDSDHSVIERAKKQSKSIISHPYDWYQLVRNAGKKKSFQVVEMQSEDFYDFSSLLKGPLVASKVTTTDNKFLWYETKWLQFRQIDSKKIYIKKSLTDESFHIVNFERRTRVEKKFELKPCYKGLQPISKSKKSDLISLLPFIHTQFHDFYKNLPVDDVPNIDPDIEVDENKDGDL